MLFNSVYSLFIRNNQCLGIDIGTYSIKVIALSRSDDKVRIDVLALVKLPLGTLVNKEVHKEESFEHALKLLRSSIPPNIQNAAIAITGSQVISKTIQVDKTLTDAEIEHYLYGNLKLVTTKVVGEVNIDFVVIGQNRLDDTLKDVFVVVAKQSLINTRISALKRAGFNCAIVDIESHAITRSLQFGLNRQNKATDVIANVHIGETTSLFIVISGDELVFSRESNIGIAHLFPKKDKTLEIKVVDKLVAQLSHCQQNYLSIFDGNAIDTWHGSGGGAHFVELLGYLSNQLKVDIHKSKPLQFLSVLDARLEHKKNEVMSIQGCFQVALGLAVRGLS